MGNDRTPLRVFFIPFFASGHMLPMADLAVLFSSRPRVEPTMVLTPANAAAIAPAIAGHRVRVLLCPFPSAESGLPAGVESLSSAPAADAWRVHRAVDLARPAQERLLREHRPDAVVADIPYGWATAVAAELGIPRITFHAVGAFPQCVMGVLSDTRAHDAAAPFVVPGLPGPPVQLVRSEVPDFLKTPDHLTDSWAALKQAQRDSYGVVVNTLHELEPEYCRLYSRTDCRRAWFVGPLSLARPGAGSINHPCLRWLDNHPPGSVLYACFGSWCHFSPEQVRAIAAGLEMSNKPFLWALRDDGLPSPLHSSPAGSGRVERGWVPQRDILAHPAVGAFMSHCGWNSVLESLSAGVPMLTWPLVFEQFINERLVTEVTSAGARLWEGFRSTVEEERVLVPADAIARAVAGFMDRRGEGPGERAMEIAGKAKAAVAEGGSSHQDLNDLIDQLLTAKEANQN